MRIAVVGGGWAGLAAAVEAVELGHQVTLFEMSGSLGGRARGVVAAGQAFDNGQHILIGAYSATLGLLKAVGIDVNDALLRMPLLIRYPDGSGLQMQRGSPGPALAKAVLSYRGWSWRERLSLLAAASGWSLRRFECSPSLTVAQLTRRLPDTVRRDFIDPLCIAALNTPSSLASARVFLRVLHDALFSGPGSADLLLPRRGLDALLPSAAAVWLKARGADVRMGVRVGAVHEPVVEDSVGAATASSLGGDALSAGWMVDGERFDAVVLACTAAEASRLTRSIAPDWSAMSSGLRYEPIVTVYLRAEGTRLAAPMLALHCDATQPAQFVFDLGQLTGQHGMFAMVVSGASDWIKGGLPALAAAAVSQFEGVLGLGGRTPDPGSHATRARAPVHVIQTLSEKRATFLCTPGLMRPELSISPRLSAAGDYIDGRYPATLEGAVRSGQAAVRWLHERG
ncbi:hydroxysqualene dehydroxylase HpnE [soil metagenome]